MIRDGRGHTGETLLWVMVSTLLFLGAVQIGRAFSLKDSLDAGVSVAVRQLSLDPSAWNEAEESVRQAVDRNFLSRGYGDQVSLVLENEDGDEISAGDLAAMGFGAEFRLRASLPLAVVIPFLGTTDRTIAVEHRMLVERYP